MCGWEGAVRCVGYATGPIFPLGPVALQALAALPLSSLGKTMTGPCIDWSGLQDSLFQLPHIQIPTTYTCIHLTGQRVQVSLTKQSTACVI